MVLLAGCTDLQRQWRELSDAAARALAEGGVPSERGAPSPGDSALAPSGAGRQSPSGDAAARTASTQACGRGRRMQIHFYDVGQGLAALVDLPDGRHILVDAGDRPRQQHAPGAGASSESWIAQLRADLKGEPIDLMWITHQHADHLGGAPEVLSSLKVGSYVDNGRDELKAEPERVLHWPSNRFLLVVGPFPGRRGKQRGSGPQSRASDAPSGGPSRERNVDDAWLSREDEAPLRGHFRRQTS